jgi:hypothetical protein
MSNTNYWAKAGLMMRESNAAGARNISLLVTPEGGGTRLQQRNSEGGSSSDHQLGASNAPSWLRIVRRGDTFTGWQSNDGETWTNSHAVTVPMDPEVLVGLAVTSHNNGAINTAIVDNISLAELPPGTSSWNSFQNNWFSAGQLANASLSAPIADPNLDEMANVFTYTSGTSPWLRAATENGGYPIVGIQDGFLSINYTRLRRSFDFKCIGEQVTARDAVPTDGVDQRFMRLRGTFLP